MTGVLCLNGGDEFHPGNEPQDELLRDAAAHGPAFIVATAASQHPEMAVRTAQGWFGSLGLQVEELRVRTRGDANAPHTAAAAAMAGLIYLVGGDPGRVVHVLRGSPVWNAIAGAWHRGAVLAGSSAGAMALCEWSLLRQGYPGHTRRRAEAALGIVRGTAVLPHFNTFGERWIPSAQEACGGDALLLGIDERTAAVWTDGAWHALGAGAVTLVRGDGRVRVPAGGIADGIPAPEVPEPDG